VNTGPIPSNFIAIGDAAPFDPISSMGIGFALTSACHGANSISHALRETTRANVAKTLQTYTEDIQKNFTQYLVTKQQVYHQEQRWANSHFNP
jgi:flavin-dependent dehydrogenase